MARRLVKDGFTCIQYSHAFPGCLETETVDGVEIHRRGGPFLFNYTVALGLRSWVRRHAIDLVLDDSNKITFLLPWFCPVPVVARFHHLFGTSIFREAGWLRALYVLFFEALIGPVYRNVATLTVSESTRAELLARGLKRVSLAPNGVDASKYRVLPEAPKEPLLILHIGRLKAYKRLDIFIRAMVRVRKELPGAHLVVAGAGSDEEALQRLAGELALGGAVKFRGRVGEGEKVRLYNQAAVFVNSSRKEGWGLTSIEANACGTPVIATDVPGLRDSVRHGESGLLVPFGDVEAFAAALLELLRDGARAARLREGALAWAARHDWETPYRVTRSVMMAEWGRQ